MTSRLVSHSNDRLREGGNADWLHGDDAWAVPLTTPAMGAALAA